MAYRRGEVCLPRKPKHCHIDRMGDISKDAGNEIPRRFAFSEVAHARHYSSILDTALAYSQHCLQRNDKVRWFFIYLPPSAGVT